MACVLHAITQLIYPHKRNGGGKRQPTPHCCYIPLFRPAPQSTESCSCCGGGHQGISKSLFCRHAGDPKQQPHRKSRAHIFNNDILATIRQGRENEKNSCTYMSDSSVTAPMKSRETSSNRCSNDSAISMLYGRSLYATNKTSSRLMKVYLAFSKS